MHRLFGVVLVLSLGWLLWQPAHATSPPSPAVGPYPTPATSTPSPTPTTTPSPTATTTPTTTPWPTETATPWVVTATPAQTTTPTAAVPQPDRAEPNNDSGQATPLGVPEALDKLSFWPIGDVDYFALQVKPSQAGLTLTVQTYVTSGLDTHLRLLAEDGTVIAENDDVSATDPRSSLAVKAVPGRYIVEVVNVAQSRPDFKTYRIETGLVQAPATPPSATTPTPNTDQGWDAYSGNYAWEFAAPIPVGEEVTQLTFGCPNFDYLDLATCLVPDFFVATVKGGTCYEARTTVSSGVDTNLIVYGPGKDSEPPWIGNDDVAPDDFSSLAAFCVPPEAGIVDAYVLVGPVGGRLPPPLSERTYTIEIRAVIPATATPVAATPTEAPLPSPNPGSDQAGGNGQGSGGATSGGLPPAPIAPVGPPTTLAAPPSQNQVGGPNVPPSNVPSPGFVVPAGVVVEELSTQLPEPTSVPLVVKPIAFLACYDRNQNKACDVDEGIGGMTVYVSDARSGTVLGQSLTDAQGQASITVRVAETAELLISVPSFAYVQRTNARVSQLTPLIVKKAAPLPALVP